MKLKNLLKNIPDVQVKGNKDIRITGLSVHSKLLFPGNLFLARRGRVYDGNLFIHEAIACGASAVLTDIYDPTLGDVVQVIHPDVASIEGLLAARYYEDPSSELFLVGVTGTNGKTTVAYLTRHLLEQTDAEVGPCGLMGTIEYLVGKHRYQATHSTPDVVTNHKLLREMLREGCRSAVMEVTSHGLDQGRVAEIGYDIAIFTNFSQDHLDYHGSMDDYFAAKQKLFEEGKKARKVAILNADDPCYEKLLRVVADDPVITFGIENTRADVIASEIEIGLTKTRFLLCWNGQSVPVELPLIGSFNVSNALAASCVLIFLERPCEEISAGLSTFPGVPGRLEKVPNDLQLHIYVDYSHTDDALANVLKTLQEVKQGRIITVFGCGGDRDRTKRPKMGAVVEKYSDLAMITSDNPRSEDPMVICEDILQGFQDKKRAIIEVDRRKAIEKAIEIAKADDIILIAGKGHETNQIFAHEILAFDDRQVVSEICLRR